MSVLFTEFEFWLSGGAANTDGGASLGGARSTAKQYAIQSFSFYAGDDTGMTPVDVQFLREVSTVDGYFLETYKDGDPDMGEIRTYIQDDWAWGYVGGYTNPPTGTVLKSFTLTETNNNGWMDITINYNTIVAPVRDEVSPGVSNDVYFTSGVTKNEQIEEISEAECLAGTTIYRCFYVRNNSAESLEYLEVNLSGHGQVDTANSGLYEWQYAVAEDDSGINGVAEVVADQNTAPILPVFTPITVGGAAVSLSVPLAPGDVLPLWLEITIPAGYSPIGDLPISALMRGWISLLFYADSPEIFYQVMAFDIENPNVIEVSVTDSIAFAVTVPTAVTQFTDSITFTDEATASATKNVSVTDSVTFTLDRSATRNVTASVEDDITISEEVAVNATLNVSVVDDINFSVELAVSGDVWDGWVVNLETNAPSRYLWSPFSSLTKFNGRYYGTTPDGVMLLEGDDDDGEDIEALIMTGVDDFDIPNDKRVLRAYVGMKASGKFLLKTVVGENEVRVYRMESTNNSMMSHRVPLGRGVDAYNWQFALHNEDGADFDAECIRIYPITLKRRFR